jgi:transcription antitermination factor NusG
VGKTNPREEAESGRSYLTEEGEALSQSSPSDLSQAAIHPFLLTPPQPAPSSEAWYAVYTTSRHEKRVHQHLGSRQIESFLPLYPVLRRWKNGCVVNVELPLFPGYLFVRMERQQRVRVLEVPGVIVVVGNSQEPMPLPEFEITSLRQNLQSHRFEPHPYLAVGERVRVRSGPLAGLQGVLSRKSNGLRFVLTLDLIKQSVAVEIAAHDLEPAVPGHPRS